MAFDVSAIAAYIENLDFPLVGAIQLDPVMTASEVTVQPKIKGSSKLHFIETDVVFQSGNNCTRSASGTTTRTDKTLTVAQIAISEDLCLNDLIGKWDQIMLKQGALTGKQVLPDEIAKIYFDQKKTLLAQQIDTADWQGDTLSVTANLNKYDGWLKYIDAGSPVAGNTSAVNVMNTTNILPALREMFLVIPTNIRNKPNLTIYMPMNYYDLWVIASQLANNYHYTGKDGDTTLFGTNIRIRPTFGLNGRDRMILTYPENLVIGLDGESDGEFNWRLDPATNKKIFVDADFTRGTQVMFTEDVVEWSFANS